MAEAKYIFEKLTPITDSDISVYESAIDFVFENNDVKNIALSGAYGAGKSSVLASYKSSHPDTKFLHISLAHFQDDQNNASSDAPIKESILEGKILNQLIHQIPAEKIPQTNFRVKKSTGNGAIICYTIATAFFLLFLLHLSKKAGYSSMSKMKIVPVIIRFVDGNHGKMKKSKHRSGLSMDKPLL